MLDTELQAKIDGVRRRQRRNRLLADATYALLVACIVFVATRLVTLRVLLPAALTWGLAAAAGFVCFRQLSRPVDSRLTAAFYIDRALNLQERLTTAVEFAMRRRTDSPLLDLQRRDAARCSDIIDPKQLVPYRLPKAGSLIVPLVILAVVLTLPRSAQPLRPQTALEESVQTIADEQAALFRRLADQLDHLSAAEERPDLRQLSAGLRALAERWERGELTADELAAELSRLEDGLNAALDQPVRQEPRQTQETPAAQAAESAPEPTGEAGRGGSGEGGDEGAGDVPPRGSAPDASDQGDAEAMPPGGSDPGTGQTDTEAPFEVPMHGGTHRGMEDPDTNPDTDQMEPGTGHDPRADDGPLTDSPPERPDLSGRPEGLPGTVVSGEGVLQQLDTRARPGEGTRQDFTAAADAAELTEGQEHGVGRETIPPAYRHWVLKYFAALAE